MATILVTGATGFIGSSLCKHLLSESNKVIGMTRDLKAAKKINPAVQWIDRLESLDGERVSGIVNLAGHSLAKGRWTASVKQSIVDSRVGFTKRLYEYFQKQMQAQGQSPDWLISGSAIGYYGANSTDQALSEKIISSGASFSQTLCQQWEDSATEFESMGVRVCLLRLGIVLGENGGALEAMLLPFKLGLGGPMGKGKHWMSWVHLADVVSIVDHCIAQSFSGPVNAVAPGAVRNAEFSKSLAGTLKKPCFMKTPAWLLKLIFGEMAEELLLSGQRVVPERLIENGFQFQFSDVDSALNDILKKP